MCIVCLTYLDIKGNNLIENRIWHCIEELMGFQNISRFQLEMSK